MSLSLFFGLLVLSLQGLHSHPFEPRIFDGKAASITDFPYQVSIQNYDRTDHHCGGVIINPCYVLTAAHCIDGFEPEEFSIISGTADWKKPGAINYASDLIPHEKFNLADTWLNDIGLIKLTKPLVFGPATSAAKLPAKNEELKVDARGIAIGFGRTSEHSGSSRQLMRTDITVKTVAYCNERYKENNFKNTQICTQGSNDAAIYKGDSGGPFIVDGKVVGITLTGMAKYPSAFTKISHYIDWIQTHMK